MKITKRQLRKIIKEELSKTLEEDLATALGMTSVLGAMLVFLGIAPAVIYDRMRYMIRPFKYKPGQTIEQHALEDIEKLGKIYKRFEKVFGKEKFEEEKAAVEKAAAEIVGEDPPVADETPEA